MNPMHEALKRHLMKATSGMHPSMSGADSSGKDDPAGSKDDEMNDDRAPDPSMPPNVDAGVGQNPNAAAPGQMNQEHAAIMQQLMHHMPTHPGRGPVSFDEKAGASMKEKMASIHKEKGGKV